MEEFVPEQESAEVVGVEIGSLREKISEKVPRNYNALSLLKASTTELGRKFELQVLFRGERIVFGEDGRLKSMIQTRLTKGRGGWEALKATIPQNIMLQSTPSGIWKIVPSEINAWVERAKEFMKKIGK